MKCSERTQLSEEARRKKADVFANLKSISLLAWLNLFFLLMIVLLLLVPGIIPPSRSEREWNVLLSATSTPLLPLAEIDTITPQVTFAQVLYVVPEAEAALNKRGLLCGTCSIARYETIEMASNVYDFDMASLLLELNTLLNRKKSSLAIDGQT